MRSAVPLTVLTVIVVLEAVVLDESTRPTENTIPEAHHPQEGPSGMAFAEFGQCYRSDLGGNGFMPCVSRGALAGLKFIAEKEKWAMVDGLELENDDPDGKETRSFLPTLDGPDGQDIRSVLSATTGLLARRSLRWNLNVLHPGLYLRIGPDRIHDLHSTNGILEFRLDRRYQTNSFNRFDDHRQYSTGRLLMRQALIPFLLGIKIPLLALVPLLFGFLVILSKKALFVSKFATLLSALLGLSSVFSSGYGSSSPHLQHQPVGVLNDPSGSGGYGIHGYRYLFRGVNYPRDEAHHPIDEREHEPSFVIWDDKRE